MWKRNQSRDGFVYAVLLHPGTSRIVVSGQNWAEATGVLVRVIDREQREVRLVAIGRDLHGVAEMSGRVGARLRIETSTLPGRLAIWSHSRPHSSDLWRRVLPASLSGVAAHITDITNDDPTLTAESVGGAALTGALQEIGSASLGGSIQEMPVVAGISLLKYLSLHPLDRSNKLGALVAALCQKQGTIWR